MSQDQGLRLYEEVLVIHPDTTERERREICAAGAEVIKNHGGKTHHLDTWGSRPLASPPAKGISRGWYFHTLFSAGPKAVQELRRQLRINRKAVYFHHEKLPPHETPESWLKGFRQILERSEAREKERQAKAQKKRGGFGRYDMAPSRFHGARSKAPAGGYFKAGFSNGREEA